MLSHSNNPSEQADTTYYELAESRRQRANGTNQLNKD